MRYILRGFALCMIASWLFVAVQIAHADPVTQDCGVDGRACVTTGATANAGGFVPLADSNQSPMFTAVYQSKDLGSYLNIIFKMAISLGAVIAVLRIAWAGYQYMTTDAWGSKQHAKEILGDVVLGLLLLLSIYLILNQINPDILKLNVLRYITPVSATPSSNTNYTPGLTTGGATTGSTQDLLTGATRPITP